MYYFDSLINRLNSNQYLLSQYRLALPEVDGRTKSFDLPIVLFTHNFFYIHVFHI